MTTLITGGTGRTGLALAKLLHAANYPVLITSRAGKGPEPFKAVKFDWLDKTTFENPFNADPSIDRVYLVIPSVFDVLSAVQPFIDLAVSKGVKRVVLVSASQVEPDDIPIGKVHKHLLDIGIDYTVLRPTWFQQNFGRNFYLSIRERNEIFSGTGNGRIPFVSIEDIAQAAFEALTAKKSPNKDLLVFGPDLYTYDEVAKLLSSVLGREITHKKLSTDETAKIFEGFGMNPEFAKMLASMEANAGKGREEELFNRSEDEKFIGKHTLLEYFQANRELWIKS
ncbi:ergot alkaloid A [Flammula alnicola]|nr:ergot alkaloid A [Flammula alnicola]